MLSIQQPLLVFSDLDGTLLDSHSYDWQPAAPWLSRLREANVPVILCSSKTSAEMLYLQKNVGATRFTADCRKWRSDPAC
ncbi:putative mannosyl-3-phosphoglycerate phosphatase [Escherichia coli 4_1_47FAA]|nr:putative mannosyl-3-phosphoglycerate phosphatase [Escherichia coli 4_1_47FAA]